MNREESLPLRQVQILGWILLGVMASCALLIAGREVALAVVVGGVLANLSFWMLQRDLTRLLQGGLVGVKARFFVKYYARLTGLAVVLFLLIKYGSLNITGLLTGLSVVFLSIGGVAVGGALKLFKHREAS